MLPGTEGALSQGDAEPPRADRAWAYFLDIDGTLVDIAPTPATVRVSDDVPKLLTRLYEVTEGAVALISGRTLADVDRLLPGLALPGAGQHGVERRDGTGAVSSAVDRGPEHDRALARLTALVQTHREVELEDKGQSFALHFRAAPHLEELIQKAARDVQIGLGPRYALRQGKCVVEIGPSASHKGEAIEAFLAMPPFCGRRPVFVGDDVTDEDGFRIVYAHRGHSIKVGDGPTNARWRLPDFIPVIRWLEGGVSLRGGTPV